MLSLHRLAAGMGKAQQEHLVLAIIGVAGGGSGISCLELYRMLQPGAAAVLQQVSGAPGIWAEGFSAKLGISHAAALAAIQEGECCSGRQSSRLHLSTRHLPCWCAPELLPLRMSLRCWHRSDAPHDWQSLACDQTAPWRAVAWNILPLICAARVYPVTCCMGCGTMLMASWGTQARPQTLAGLRADSAW